MKEKKFLPLLLAVLLLVSVMAACGSPAGNSETAATVSVIDMTGREISLDAPATKLVALSAADCEIVFALGAGHALVGRGEYCGYPAEAAGIPIVQSGAGTNVEQIINLEPQVVLMNTMAQSEELVAQLENAGIEVVVSTAEDIHGVYEAIAMVGTVVGRETAAAELISNMKQSFADIEISTEAGGGKTVYFEVSPLEYGLWTAGNGTFMDEIADIIGLENIFSDVEGWAEVSEEQVIYRNPDYIVTLTAYESIGQDPIEEIRLRDAWRDISAVRNEAVLNFADDELTVPGPRLALGAEVLYEFVYGKVE